MPAVAALVLVLSIGPAILLAVAGAAAPWAWPLASTAAVFGVVLAANMVRGRSWARRAALVILYGVATEGVLFTAVSALVLEMETAWTEGMAVAVAVAVLSLAGVAVLRRHRAWFAT